MESDAKNAREDLAEIEVKDFRQPLVTAQGIILGFLLGFVGEWVTEPTFTIDDTGSRVLLGGCCFAILAFVTVILRILSPSNTARTSVAHYTLTLRLFASGVICLLLSFLLSAII
jgi:hypothetical protein